MQTPPSAPTNLADRSFWEDDYLGGIALPARPDPEFPFDQALVEALTRHAPARAQDRVLEIGCAPGRWLLFYAETFGARPAGIEYTDVGVEMTRRNLAAAGIAGEVVAGDFFSVDTQPGDLVLSLGFIEHFDDLHAAFVRHLDFLAPGGRLVLGVPNFRGVLGAVQQWIEPGHRAMHNLEAMQPSLHRRLALEHGLVLEWQGYLGGLDPSILKPGRTAGLPLIVALEQLHRRGLSRGWRRPGLSAYLMTVMRRSASPAHGQPSVRRS